MDGLLVIGLAGHCHGIRGRRGDRLRAVVGPLFCQTENVVRTHVTGRSGDGAALVVVDGHVAQRQVAGVGHLERVGDRAATRGKGRVRRCLHDVDARDLRDVDLDFRREADRRLCDFVLLDRVVTISICAREEAVAATVRDLPRCWDAYRGSRTRRTCRASGRCGSWARGADVVDMPRSGGRRP